MLITTIAVENFIFLFYILFYYFFFCTFLKKNKKKTKKQDLAFHVNRLPLAVDSHMICQALFSHNNNNVIAIILLSTLLVKKDFCIPSLIIVSHILSEMKVNAGVDTKQEKVSGL